MEKLSQVQLALAYIVNNQRMHRQTSVITREPDTQAHKTDSIVKSDQITYGWSETDHASTLL